MTAYIPGPPAAPGASPEQRVQHLDAELHRISQALGELSDVVPLEVWQDTTPPGLLVVSPYTPIVPAFVPVYTGQAANLWTVSAGGILTAQFPFVCTISIYASCVVSITANNGETDWAIAKTGTSLTFNLFPNLQGFDTSSRTPTYSRTPAASGIIGCDTGDTLGWNARDEGSISANVVCNVFTAVFSDVRPVR